MLFPAEADKTNQRERDGISLRRGVKLGGHADTTVADIIAGAVRAKLRNGRACSLGRSGSAKQAGTVQERKPTLPTPRRVIAMNVPMQVSISRSRTSMAPELDIVIRRLDAGDVLVVTRLDRAPVGLASRGASPPRLECISARPG